MAGINEKKLQEFIRNTGADRDEAIGILDKNGWNISHSYLEIEKMCKHRGQQQLQQHYNLSQKDVEEIKSGGAAHQKAIDMGLGVAVHLGKNSVAMPPRPHNPQPQRHSADPSLYHPQQSGLSVKLPSSSDKHQGQTSPIKVEGGKGNPPLTNHPNHYKIPHSGPVSPVPSYQGQAAAPQQLNYTNAPKGDSHHSQPRAILEETVHPSRPTMVPPERKSHVVDHCEEDDVFDEKAMSKTPASHPYPRLKRGFSNILENEFLVSEARTSVQSDIRKESHDNMYVQTFVLPDLTVHPEDFRAFLEKDLIETSTLVSLEQAGRLNWWAELHVCQRLLPMATTGDGNCLLHAASLAMWGIHDRQLILRKELHETLTNVQYKDTLYRRWRYQQTMSNKESGLMFNESEWTEEWRNVLRLASPIPRRAPDPSRSKNCCDSAVTQGCEEPVVYESLEEFHVFVLAHVLRRPIIVVADTILKDASGEALAPIPFSGIYLPLEVNPCYRSPLLLTYDAAHFSALAPMEHDKKSSSKLPDAIPLVDPDLKLLPLHFHIDPGPKVDWNKGVVIEPSIEDRINLLQKYLDVERIQLQFSDVCIDSDRGSCGSQDSDDTSSMLKDNKKDKKKDAKMSQQMQTVAKQFGSIGKTVGKKIKQLGKGGKGDKGRRPSVGSVVTQSTRVIAPVGGNKECILVAKLSEKRGKQQQEMIKNYLHDAAERFVLDRELKRKNDAELRSRVFLHPPVNSGMSSSGPANYGHVSQAGNNQFVYNTFPGRGRQQPMPPPMGSNDYFQHGKSKFYASSNEDMGQPAQSVSLAVSNMDKKMSRSSHNVGVSSHHRSPSPDYDNYEYARQHSNTTRPVSDYPRPAEIRQRCRTEGCEFYGSSESAGWCSKCFQHQAALQKAAHTGTKL